MGKDLMTRICEKLKIEPYEFYLREDSPVVKDPAEREILYKYRMAKQLTEISDAPGTQEASFMLTYLQMK